MRQLHGAEQKEILGRAESGDGCDTVHCSSASRRAFNVKMLERLLATSTDSTGAWASQKRTRIRVGRVLWMMRQVWNRSCRGIWPEVWLCWQGRLPSIGLQSPAQHGASCQVASTEPVAQVGESEGGGHECRDSHFRKVDRSCSVQWPPPQGEP